MARRYTNTSHFDPYSFQELWAPAQYATQAHAEQAQSFAAMDAQAESLGSFIDPQKDPEEYRAWLQYTDNLRRGSESLMRNGLSGTTFNTLWQSTVDYGKKIKPIEFAVENKQKFAQMMNQTALQHPDMLFVQDINDYSLKEYRNGIPRPEMIDLNAVQKEAATMASIYANNQIRFADPERYDRYRDIIRQKYGDTFEEALNNIQDPTSLLSEIKRRVMESSGASRLLDTGKTGAYARLENAVDNAIISGATGKMDASLDNTRGQMELNWAKHNLNEREFEHRVDMDTYNIMKANQDAALAAQAEESEWLNSLSWHPVSGLQSPRVYGWATAASGKQAREWQNIIYGNATSDGRPFKVYTLDGKQKTLKAPNGSTDGDSFAITFEGPKNESEFNQGSTPYYIMQWNGELYRVSPEQIGLPEKMVEEMNYIFGNPNTVRPELEPARQLATEYRQDHASFEGDTTRYIKDASTGQWYISNDGTGITKSEMLDKYINGYTIAAEKALFSTAKPFTTTYKING